MKNINKLEEIREYLDLKEDGNFAYGISIDEDRKIASITIYDEVEDISSNDEGKEVVRFSVNEAGLILEYLHEDFSYYFREDMLKKIQEILNKEKNITKEEIIERLLKDFEDKEEMKKEKYHNVNDKSWTLADLVIRQYLNNGGDGFDMVNVEENYKWLKTIKDDLIKYNLLSKEGTNNSGFTLWENYKF